MLERSRLSKDQSEGDPSAERSWAPAARWTENQLRSGEGTKTTDFLSPCLLRNFVATYCKYPDC